MAWSYVGTDDAGAVPATMQPVPRTGEPLGVNIPGKRATAPPAPPSPSGGYDVPPEADDLFGRIRQAEGTAKGDGYLIYGGDAFIPGKEHPGDIARRMGPGGRETHAAGPGQWQPGTWNGLKPDFREKFGRDPDFSDTADQKRMAWLNGAKAYGGEDKLRADIAAGKLDTGKLAGQWAGFKGGGGGPWTVTQSGKWTVDDKAVAFAQSKPRTGAFWGAPNEVADMLPPMEGGDDAKVKRRSLLKSLSLGESINDIPEIEVQDVGNGRLKIIDYDGRNRLKVAQQEGIGAVPVAFKGLDPTKKYDWIEDMRGQVRPFNFQPVPKAGEPPSVVPAGLQPTTADQQGVAGAHQAGAVQRSANPIVQEAGRLFDKAVDQTAASFAAPAIGAAEPVVGTAQLAARGAEAIGVPGAAPVARILDDTAQGVDRAVQAMPTDQRIAAGVGNAAAMMLGPGAGIASLPRLARPFAAAGLGAAAGAAQPVASPDNYWGEKAKQTGIGAVLGGALQVGGGIVSAGRNAMSRFVSPSTVTSAAARILGENAKKITPEMMDRVRRKIGSELDRIEKGYDVKIDTQLIKELVDTSDKARLLLGDQAGPIERAIDNIVSRMQGNIIPGPSAANVWHKGSRLDTLTESRDPEIASLAQAAQNAVRSALNRSLPASEALAYSAARHNWRDMKIVEKSMRPGETELNPGRLQTQINRRFPNNAYNLNPPEMLKLGRAVGETFTPRSALLPHVAASALGGVVGHGAGGPLGAAMGAVSGNLLVDRLLRLRYASPNAMTSLRPGPPANPFSLGQFAAPATAPLTMPGSPAMAR